MARYIKQTVDYFPHIVKPGNALFILEGRYGNDGYVFLFKLLETLCQSDGLCFDFKETVAREVFLTKTRITEEAALAMLDVMAKLNNIDPELWNRQRVVWSQDLVNNLSEVWRRRASPAPTKPDLCRQSGDINEPKPPKTAISSDINAEKSGRNAQSKVKESRGGGVPHNVNDNHIVSDKDKSDAPPAMPAAAPGKAQKEQTPAGNSDSKRKEEDVRAVTGAFIQAKRMKFANDTARLTYERGSDVYFPACDILDLAGGDVALAVRAVKDHAAWYREQGKDQWDLRWVKKDFVGWDTERREYEQERV